MERDVKALGYCLGGIALGHVEVVRDTHIYLIVCKELRFHRDTSDDDTDYGGSSTRHETQYQTQYKHDGVVEKWRQPGKKKPVSIKLYTVGCSI